MGLEKIKKSLVLLDQSLDTLEEVISKREQAHNERYHDLSNQIDMFSKQQEETSNNNSNFDREKTVQKLDEVINRISTMIES
jgi:DNA-binding protein H-NS